MNVTRLCAALLPLARKASFLIIAGALLFFAPPLITRDLPVGEPQPAGGAMYTAPLRSSPIGMAASLNFGAREIVVLENGRYLGPSHDALKDIRDRGNGRYFYSGNIDAGRLYWSATDNSDPRQNRRTYSVGAPDGRWRLMAVLIVFAGLGLLFLPQTVSRKDLDVDRRPPQAWLLVLAALCVTIGISQIWASGSDSQVALTIDRYTRILAPDVLILCGCAYAGFAIERRYFSDISAGWGTLIGVCCAFVLSANMTFLGATDFALAYAPDSGGYFEGSLCRPPGYPLLLRLFGPFDSKVLVVFQVNMLLAAMIAAAVSVTLICDAPMAGLAVIALEALFGGTLGWSLYALTDAPFAAAFGALVALSVAYVMRPRTPLALGIGLAVTISLCLKPAAAALLLPSLLLLWRRQDNRLLNALLIVSPPILALMGIVAMTRAETGRLAFTGRGGIALAGHVAYAIRTDNTSSDPQLSAEIESRLKPFFEKWPSPWKIRSYADATARDYNAVLWSNLYPLVLSRLPASEIQGRCPPRVEALLMQLSHEAIVRDPVRYALHVLNHFAALWSQAFSTEPWETASSRARVYASRNLATVPAALAPPQWRNDNARSAIFAVAANRQLQQGTGLSSVKSLLRNFIGDGRSPGYLLSVIAVGFSILGFAFSRLPQPTAAAVIAALMINAYFGAHALAQVALKRYTDGAMIGIAIFIVVAATITIRHFSKLWRQKT